MLINKRFAATTAGVAACLVLAACNSSTPAGSTGSTTPGTPAAASSGATSSGATSSGATQATTSELNFTSTNATTGQNESYGGPAVKEQQLLTDSINSQGGFKDNCGNTYHLNLTVFDVANSVEQGLTGLKQAAADPKQLFVLGADPDTINLAAIPAAGQLKMPYLIPVSGAIVPAWNPYAWRVQGTGLAEIVPMLATLKASPDGLKSIAVIYDQTEGGQNGFADAIKSNAARFDFQVPAYEAFRAGDSDFGPQLTKIKALNPQYVAVMASQPEQIKIVNQMHALQMSQTVINSNALSVRPEVWDGTQGLVKGAIFFAPGITGGDMQVHDPLALSLYKDKYGEIPNIYGVMGWDIEKIALEAVKNTCSSTDREKFTAFVDSLKDFPAATLGVINFKNPPSGDNVTPGVAVGITTGRGTFTLMQTVTPPAP